MTSHIMDPHNPLHPQYQLGLEAGQWLAQLTDLEPSPDDPYFEPEKRSAAFLEWLTRSPQHLAMFLETYEAYQRLGNIDSKKRIQIKELLEKRDATVIHLFGPAPQNPQPARRRWAVAGLAATIVTFGIGGLISWKMFGADEFTTSIGEQRTRKLEDGSFIYLNTDSRVKIDFTRQQRHIDLTRGEALFAVEHDPQRPFVVTANGTNIRAVGTQFNVRRRADSTDVAVIQGIVQVTTDPHPSPLPSMKRVPKAGEDSGSETSSSPTGLLKNPHPVASRPSSLVGGEGSSESRSASVAVSPSNGEGRGEEFVRAGEVASVVGGRLNKLHANVAEALSWRQRQLVFQNTPLTEVAAEFNRYNLRQIRVEGPVRMELTGTFDADRPNALVLYAMKQTSLDVEPVGENWVIHSK